MNSYACAILAKLLTFFLGISATQSANHVGSEAVAIRTFLYVGGGYSDDGNGGHIFKDQMYVEKLSPPSPRHDKYHPIVLIHGQGQTGTSFLNKPDGGKSWTSQFIEAGYTVYIVDQTFRGRSAWAPRDGALAPSTYSAERIQERFTAPQNYNLWPQAKLHTQWPGTGVMGDSIFDTFYSSNIQFISNATYQQQTVQSAGADLLDLIGKPAWLLGHSQGGLKPSAHRGRSTQSHKRSHSPRADRPAIPRSRLRLRIGTKVGFDRHTIDVRADRCTVDPLVDLVKQVVLPANSSSNNTNNATVPCVLQAKVPAPRRLPNLSPLPILTVTGEASYHAPYDYCTVELLKQAGCMRAGHLDLGKAGVHGNGHMMFMEKNSEEIWERLHQWMEGGSQL